MMNAVTKLVTLVAAASIMLVVSGVQNVMAQCSALLDADLDVSEAGNATSMTTNQTADMDMTYNDVQFLTIQNALSGSLSEINATSYSLELLS